MRGLFVTGTDTGVGKTVVSASLIASMVAAGERVRAFKPVVTGLDAPPNSEAHELWPADHELLASVADMSPEEVSPRRFGPAVSPHLAAELAGESIDPAALLARARGRRDDSQGEQDTLIVEGVGGLLVPLTDDYSVCDFASALGLPIVIVARPGLGTINHTLLTLRVARAAGLKTVAVVLTPWPPEPTVMERSNRATISRIGEVEVAGLAPLSCPEPAELQRAGEELPWRRWLQP
ncbi:MAG TPA: dethiobiotin synthase [Solirubrobacteraceae bacterium]|jgi:dethiobiotin synthetase